MKIFEGKSPTEKKKLIAAFVLGGLALLVLSYNVIGMFSGGKKTVTVNVSPTPTATVSSRNSGANDTVSSLNQEQINQEWLISPVAYTPPGYAPEAGRNIFAFYEPAEPTPYSPTPTPPPPPPSPTPTPKPPDYTVAYVSPQSVYAGSKSFRLEVNGDKFEPNSVIVWNGSQLPTYYVSPQKLTADIQAGLIASEGQPTIMVRSADGSKYSNQTMITVEAPPKPNFQFIGLMARNRSNNDTATLQEKDKPTAPPFNVRLNDIVGGRFRTVSISAKEVILEDTTLGFRHPLPLVRADSSNQGGRGGFGDRFQNRFPQTPNYNPPPSYNPPATTVPQDIPGIPNNIPRYVPPQQPQQQQRPPRPQQQQQKDDDEDDDDGDGRP